MMYNMMYSKGDSMVTGMVRKQVYIYQRQEGLLKRLARRRGVSEAEIIRQAIDREAISEEVAIPADSQNAWVETMRFVEERKALGLSGEPYKWNREEIYEEREGRWLRKAKG
jgi:Zn-dependent peptidase ImmA (M78 family)